MDSLGYTDMGFGYDSWTNSTCNQVYALVFPADENVHVRFLVLDKKTGRIIATLADDQVERQLHSVINYQGGLSSGNMLMKGKKMFFLGFLQDQPDTGVYIHLNRNACGLALDQILYRSPWETKAVPLDIRLGP